MGGMLEPATTLRDIYGSHKIFVARSSPNATCWLPKGEIALDMMTSGMLTILGDMPVLCAASVSTPEGLHLLLDAGFHLPPEIIQYNGASQYLSLIRQICNEGRTFVTQHVHPQNEVPKGSCWIDPAVLSWVNNKANLEVFVPEGFYPTRAIVQTTELTCNAFARNTPVVIKAVTDESTGGGVDVRICRNEDDLRKAADYFSDCEQVVVEQFLDIRNNLCLHYYVKGDGEIVFLGVAGQVSDEQGIYRGNWIEDGAKCPAVVVEVGRKIARVAFERGYYGVLGIDVAILADGQCKVFDLNFRGNGSTPGVLFITSIHQCYGKSLIRFRRFTGKGDYRQMLDAIYQGMADEIFLPAGSCDPSVGPYPAERPLVAGFVLGGTRPEILENERRLAAFGLCT